MIYTEQDFEAIYHATVTRLSKHVFFKVQSIEDAQDLVQDLYFEFYKQMQKCTEKIENPQAYLITMADHALTRYYRDKLRRPVTLIDEETDPFLNLPDDQDLEKEVLDHLADELLWSSILALGEPEKSLMIGRYRFDQSFVELAKAFDLPETTIKSKVYKVLETLKHRFDK